MRNLKRALSLLLSSTMVLGMVVMGGSAAGYQDVDASNDNQEAIEVLQAVGIMSGVDDAGNFNPDGSLTRNEMAVVMAHLLNLDYDYYRGVNTFSDVPEWAAPYVAACVAEGVTAGIGNGLYGGDQKITAAQAGLMVMKALGYFQNQEDFGTDWQVATIRQASYIDLYNNVNSNAESALTRGQVAQLVLNGLKAKMVDFTGDKGIQIGDVTVGYRAEYTAKTSAANKYNTIDDGTTNIAENDQYYVQLGEELYNGDLKLSNSGEDDFGRPSRVWEYKGEEIGTYAKKELIAETYTTKVEGGDIYGDIGASACKYDLTYWVDGVKYSKSATAAEADKLVRNNESRIGTTYNGVLTEVYVDTKAEELTIVEVHTYLAQAITDYNSTNGRITVSIYTGRNSDGTIQAVSQRLENEDLPAIVDYKEDDFMMITMANGVVKSVADPQVVADAYVNAYASDPDDGDDYIDTGRLTKVTADGKDYKISSEAYYDPAYLYDYSDSSQQLDGYTYNLMLDPYGYLLGIENVTDDENYFFVVGYEPGSSVLAKSIDKALVIFPDGTMKTVDAMEKDDSGLTIPKSGYINTWYNYTQNADGVYVISSVTDNQFVEKRSYTAGSEDKINSSNTTMAVTVVRDDSTTDPSYVYGNNDSVYISVEADNDVVPGTFTLTDVSSVSTGIKNTSIVPTGSVLKQTGGDYNVFGLYNNQGYVTYAVVLGEDGSVADNFVYLTSGITGSYYDSETKQYVYQYDAITKDSDEVVTVNSLTRVDTSTNWLTADTLYEASYDADGFITKMVLKTDDNDGSTINSTNGTYNTETYKDYGYGQMTITGGNKQQVILSGAVLYLNAADNNQYVVLDEDVRFFVNGKDDTNGEYDLYPTATAALAALGKGNEISSTAALNGKIVVICDPTTGFGKTVIILDQVYEEDGIVTPPTGGKISLTGVSIGGTSIGSPAGYADIDDAVSNARTISLSSAQLDQKLSLTASSTNSGVTNIRATVKVFNTKDDVYHFVGGSSDSNTFAAAATTVTGTTGSGLALGNGNVVVIEIHDNTTSTAPVFFAYIVNTQA